MILNALIFTLFQASLSAALSVIIGGIWARIYMRRVFLQNPVVDGIMRYGFFLPPLFVAVLVLRAIGAEWALGWRGIVISHVLLNLPLCIWMFVNAWRATSPASLRLARTLDTMFWGVEYPVIRQVAPYAFGLVFLLSVLSFTIVLLLGGGGYSVTLEMAIYQALRYEFDLVTAFSLAMIQAAIGYGVYIALRRQIATDWAGDMRIVHIPPPMGRMKFAMDMLMALALLSLAALPLFLWLFDLPEWLPFWQQFIGQTIFWRAVANSLMMALGTTLLANFLAWGMVWYQRGYWAYLIGAISPLAISVFLILILRAFINPFDIGLPIVILLQAFAFSPILVRFWQAGFERITPEDHRLLAVMDMNWGLRLRWFWWPLIKDTLRRCLVLAMALAIGDLALLPLFAPPNFVTLPILTWQAMGQYRFDQAFALAALTMMLTLLLLAMAAERKGVKNA